MVKITEVTAGSLAARAGILPGDTLVSIDGNEINDVLDYRFYLTSRKITLSLLGELGEYSADIRKGEYDDIGLEFETPLMDKKHSCKNKCIFCFIDQNPKGLRDSLYFKDDDSRLSFIHGNYITLTNMQDSDIDRIIKMRMSPINISIHTTNPELRVKMMKNKRSGEVLGYLDRFSRAGLGMCGQIVLCRGVNDGKELERTISDLKSYYPALTSVAIVPAGLTAHRDGLYPLSDFTREEAREVIATVNAMGERCLGEYGTRMFYLADEFYLKAELPIPDTDYYEDYPQIENGVGMLRSFSDEYNMALEDLDLLTQGLSKSRCVTIVTGVAAYPMLSLFAEQLMSRSPLLKIKVKCIVNNFFGRSITVAGLLTGKDILEQLGGEELGDAVFIPENCLKHGEDIFLCGMTVDELSEALGTPVLKSVCDGYAFVEALFGTA